jgi:hypothetical protein
VRDAALLPLPALDTASECVFEIDEPNATGRARTRSHSLPMLFCLLTPRASVSADSLRSAPTTCFAQHDEDDEDVAQAVYRAAGCSQTLPASSPWSIVSLHHTEVGE